MKSFNQHEIWEHWSIFKEKTENPKQISFRKRTETRKRKPYVFLCISAYIFFFRMTWTRMRERKREKVNECKNEFLFIYISSIGCNKWVGVKAEQELNEKQNKNANFHANIFWTYFIIITDFLPNFENFRCKCVSEPLVPKKTTRKQKRSQDELYFQFDQSRHCCNLTVIYTENFQITPKRLNKRYGAFCFQSLNEEERRAHKRMWKQ